jgi:hypothetical protein
MFQTVNQVYVRVGLVVLRDHPIDLTTLDDPKAFVLIGLICGDLASQDLAPIGLEDDAREGSCELPVEDCKTLTGFGQLLNNAFVTLSHGEPLENGALLLAAGGLDKGHLQPFSWGIVGNSGSFTSVTFWRPSFAAPDFSSLEEEEESFDFCFFFFFFCFLLLGRRRRRRAVGIRQGAAAVSLGLLRTAPASWSFLLVFLLREVVPFPVLFLLPALTVIVVVITVIRRRWRGRTLANNIQPWRFGHLRLPQTGKVIRTDARGRGREGSGLGWRRQGRDGDSAGGRRCREKSSGKGKGGRGEGKRWRGKSRLRICLRRIASLLFSEQLVQMANVRISRCEAICKAVAFDDNCFKLRMHTNDLFLNAELNILGG